MNRSQFTREALDNKPIPIVLTLHSQAVPILSIIILEDLPYMKTPPVAIMNHNLHRLVLPLGVQLPHIETMVVQLTPADHQDPTLGHIVDNHRCNRVSKFQTTLHDLLEIQVVLETGHRPPLVTARAQAYHPAGSGRYQSCVSGVLQESNLAGVLEVDKDFRGVTVGYCHQVVALTLVPVHRVYYQAVVVGVLGKPVHVLQLIPIDT